jgi:acetyltransferase-like isoleucine patch superfamily enzyme
MLTRPASLLRSIFTRGRIFWLRARGVQLSIRTRLDRGVEFALGIAHSQRGRIVAEHDCHFSTGAILHAYGGNISLGPNVYVGPYTVIYGHGGVEIGGHTLISMHCRILSSNHTVPSPDTTIRSQPDILLPTKIGRDVWLGAGVTVLGGVTIGDGCVVGAGAVVTKDLPPNVIAVGVPARVISERR